MHVNSKWNLFKTISFLYDDEKFEKLHEFNFALSKTNQIYFKKKINKKYTKIETEIKLNKNAYHRLKYSFHFLIQVVWVFVIIAMRTHHVLYWYWSTDFHFISNSKFDILIYWYQIIFNKSSPTIKLNFRMKIKIES